MCAAFAIPSYSTVLADQTTAKFALTDDNKIKISYDDGSPQKTK
jgi:hypothetical protein